MGACVLGTIAVGVILPWAALALGGPLVVALAVPALLTWRRGGDDETAALAGHLSARIVDALAGAPELLVFGGEADVLGEIEQSAAHLDALERRHAAAGHRLGAHHSDLSRRRRQRGPRPRRCCRPRTPPWTGDGGCAPPRRVGDLRDGARRSPRSGPIAGRARVSRPALRVGRRPGPRPRPRRALCTRTGGARGETDRRGAALRAGTSPSARRGHLRPSGRRAARPHRVERRWKDKRRQRTAALLAARGGRADAVGHRRRSAGSAAPRGARMRWRTSRRRCSPAPFAPT